MSDVVARALILERTKTPFLSLKMVEEWLVKQHDWKVPDEFDIEGTLCCLDV